MDCHEGYIEKILYILKIKIEIWMKEMNHRRHDIKLTTMSNSIDRARKTTLPEIDRKSLRKSIGHKNEIKNSKLFK